MGNLFHRACAPSQPTNKVAVRVKRFYQHIRRLKIDAKFRRLVRRTATKRLNYSVLKRRLTDFRQIMPKEYRDKIKTEFVFLEEVQKKNVIEKLPSLLMGTPPRTQDEMDFSTPELCQQNFDQFNGPPSHQPITPDMSPKQCDERTCALPIDDYSNEVMEIVYMSAGKYLHYGLQEAIQNNTQGWPVSLLHLTVAIYVHEQKYIMLIGKVFSNKNERKLTSRDFIIGLYEGAITDVRLGNEILRPFVTEYLLVKSEHEGEFKECVDETQSNIGLRVKLHAIVVDQQAISIILCTALLGSIYACPKCRLIGQYVQSTGCLIFPSICAKGFLRSDNDFDGCFDRNYHLAYPLAQQLRIGLVTQVVLDYKHIVCLGVMRRLWNLWTKGRLEHRINKATIKQMERQLFIMGKQKPLEFRSGPPSPLMTDTWTPYDWRQFLLYYGPVVLKDALPGGMYKHFMHLHLAMRLMLCRHEQCNANLVGVLINEFVKHFAEVYGDDNVDYNVHHLLHYEAVFRRFGSIEDVGGFDFDDTVNELQYCLSSWDDSIDVLETLRNDYLNKSEDSIDGTLAHNIGETLLQKSRLRVKDFVVSDKHPDNNIVTAYGFVKVVQIIESYNNTTLFVGQRYQNRAVHFYTPLTDYKLWLVSEENNLETFQVSDVISKAVRYDTSNGVYVAPILTK